MNVVDGEILELRIESDINNLKIRNSEKLNKKLQNKYFETKGRIEKLLNSYCIGCGSIFERYESSPHFFIASRYVKRTCNGLVKCEKCKLNINALKTIYLGKIWN